jgi:ATP-dependent exoDNAse (exonuclease V) beta subunit
MRTAETRDRSFQRPLAPQLAGAVTLAENLRLSVSLTRAKNRCYLVWGADEAETSSLATSHPPDKECQIAKCLKCQIEPTKHLIILYPREKENIVKKLNAFSLCRTRRSARS